MCINKNEHTHKYNNSVVQNLFQYNVYIYICWHAIVQRYLLRSSMTHGFIFPITFAHVIFFANPAKIGRKVVQNPTGMRLLAVDQICIKK